MPYTVTLIPGDGVGPEVMTATCRVLEATGVEIRWDTHQVGVAAVSEGRSPLDEEVLASVRRNGVALKGPVSTPVGRTGFRSVNVELRRSLSLSSQVRPCKTYGGVEAPAPAIDVVVIRNTTEDLYAGVELDPGTTGAQEVIDVARRHGAGSIPADAGLSIKYVSETACRALVDFGLAYARRHGRRKVTFVHKATVMRSTDGLFLQIALEAGANEQTLEISERQVDDLCGQLVRRAADFDVLVMGNQYGDIVSDLAAGLAGGIGLAPGANYGRDAAMFEPAHGTARRHAGRNEVNPVGAILSGALLLEHLGESRAARRVQDAVAGVLADGSAVTYDQRPAGTAADAVGTSDMADAIIARLSAS